MIPRLAVVCAAVAAAALPVLAWAQSLRQLPSDLALTTMRANGGAVVVLGDKRVQLSPAAQVRGADNLLILPANLYGTHKVGVKTDLQGMVSRIWILTADEWTALKKAK